METGTSYLVDTNIWLERLLEQEKSEIAARFLNLTPPQNLFISDFSLHSIGLILSKLGRSEILEQFIKDLFIDAQIELLTTEPLDLLDVSSNIRTYELDFDDAYQLTVAHKYELTIVTFDKDFNVPGIRKKSPEEALAGK